MLQIASVNFDRDPKWAVPEMVLNHFVVAYILEGNVRYTLDGKTIVLQGGDVIMLPIGMKRVASSVPEAPHQKYTLLYTVSPSLEKDLLPHDDPSTYRTFRVQNDQYVHRRFSALYDKWQEVDTHSKVISHGIGLELIGYLYQELSLMNVSPQKIRLANEVKKFVFAHYTESITVDDIAAYIGRTKSYIIRVFREVMGQTPIEYLHTFRISQARNMLLNTQRSIESIAYELGFCDQSHFTRVYKKLEGTPPSYLRK